MAAYELFICGNDETICDGYTDDRTEAWKDEIGTLFVEEAARVIRRAEPAGIDFRDIDYTVNHTFRDWHGGRFDQFYQRCGLIAIAKDAPQWLVDLAWQAEEAGCKVRDEYIAELEAEHDKLAAEENA